MINMSAQKPMFLDSLLFSSVFLGSVLCKKQHVFSGGYESKTSTRALQYTIPKQYRVLLDLHVTQRQLESPGRQNAAQ